MPVAWRKQLISDERYESVGVFDVNNDGVLDIVSGAYWYEGSDFTHWHKLADLEPYGDYFDDFACLPVDVDGDGYTDFVTGGWFEQELQWLRNPGSGGGLWTKEPIAKVGNIETIRAWDIDGDGKPEFVPNTPGGPLVVWRHVGPSTFEPVEVYSAPQGHGLGCGDIAGHGRADLVLAGGWLEAPADPWSEPWQWHPDFDLGGASVPILVADVNGDSLSDLIVGQAHGYGLDWLEQRKGADGRREWVRHPIDPWNSQYHDMQWADIDGDGLCELLTGKRYRAHARLDPGDFDAVGIYYFKWTGEAFCKQVIDYGPPRQATGCGIHFALADLRGCGRLDLIAPGKDGLYVFWNEGSES